MKNLLSPFCPTSRPSSFVLTFPASCTPEEKKTIVVSTKKKVAPFRVAEFLKSVLRFSDLEIGRSQSKDFFSCGLTQCRFSSFSSDFFCFALYISATSISFITFFKEYSCVRFIFKKLILQNPIHP